MQHELFRHIEIEMFVTRSRLAAAIDFVKKLLRHAGGETVEWEDEVSARLATAGQWESLWDLKGRYVHHYPICIRKVLPDATLISMASGEEPCYALSFISYVHPRRRAGFFHFAEVLARSLALLFAARPHWGKHCPLGPHELVDLYPRFADFNRLRSNVDPQGVFLNSWLEEVFDE
jgi:hypothetical protein